MACVAVFASPSNTLCSEFTQSLLLEAHGNDDQQVGSINAFLIEIHTNTKGHFFESACNNPPLEQPTSSTRLPTKS